MTGSVAGTFVMPELPDVEILKGDLSAKALHQTITGVRVEEPRVLADIGAARFRSAVSGRRMESTWRYGKYLFADLDDGRSVAFHFGMTGWLRYSEEPEANRRHDRIRFDFENGHGLAFENQRLLGRVRLVDDGASFIAAQGLGPDAADPALNAGAFAKRLDGRRGKVKSTLMNQDVVAGIGNIVSDEVLFQARLHPETPVEGLTDNQRRGLGRALRRVVATTVERGVGSEKHVDRLPRRFLVRDRRAGSTCPRCGTEIRRVRVTGRTAYFCPVCQPPEAGPG